MVLKTPCFVTGSHGYWNATSGKLNWTVPYPTNCVPEKELCPPPHGMMGGNIHPRNKRLLGERIARAAKAIAYDDHTIAFTGPVVTGCVAGAGGTITFSFNETLMRCVFRSILGQSGGRSWV